MAARSIVGHKSARAPTALQAFWLPMQVLCVGAVVTGILIAIHLMEYEVAAVIVGEVTLLASFDTVHCLICRRRAARRDAVPGSKAAPATVEQEQQAEEEVDDLGIWRRFLETLDDTGFDP